MDLEVKPSSPPNHRTLPSEIIHQILSYFCIQDLSTLSDCSLVSRQFNGIATPLLWRWLYLKPPTTIHTEQDAQEPSHQTKTENWTVDLLKHVKILSISTHQENWCAHSKIISLPNLEVLRLKVHSELSGRSEYHHELNFGQPEHDPQPCPLVKNLKPKVIIWERTGYSSLCLDEAPSLPTSVWSHVETLIFLASSIDAGTRHTRCNFSLPKEIPKLKKIYWIYDPVSTYRDEEVHWSDQEPFWSSIPKLDTWVLLNVILRSPRCDIDIVNLRSTVLRRRHLRDSFTETQKLMKIQILNEMGYELEGAMDQDFIIPKDMKYCSEHLSFLSMAEFIAEKDARGWFEPFEVRAWQDAMYEAESGTEEEREKMHDQSLKE
ncbi:uncharacterized protein I303_102002 [Kwoniella dejecticola CBS 10117]|uniref:F-box domain-containing protein n=1 Tax=Kwoniella dejecticola CBS 10117 TaxID=1296121 RepID=A0A1A6AC60_9TREE|nr:uncharacterized protein I303_01860 [Kwoniella dejecticola CBS 10117]OBR87652.1 hypothetical protein I303_01860 [Kwoniella dejecticola CBS 10117]